jgi:hypothetical protein
VKPGDQVRVVRLPKYWGAADIRNLEGIIISHMMSSDGKIIMNWKHVLIGDKAWKIPDYCLELISETR